MRFLPATDVAAPGLPAGQKFVSSYGSENLRPENRQAKPLTFSCIVADPPWEYPEGFSTQPRSKNWSGPIVHDKPLPYPAMSVEEICKLGVRELAGKDCRLWLWTTNRYLPAAFSVVQAWGFEYKQTLVWHKSDGNMGGSVAANSAEFLIVAVRGNPKIEKRLPSAVVKLPQSKQHSRKPKEWLWLIEQTTDGCAARLEMFARRKRSGWSAWGNEFENDVAINTGAVAPAADSPNAVFSDSGEKAQPKE